VEGEAAGPRRLLGGGETDLEEREALQLAGAGQGADVGGLETGTGDDVRELGLRVGVVAGDEDRGGLVADGARGQGGAEIGVEPP
jgi:hypothetical protein